MNLHVFFECFLFSFPTPLLHFTTTASGFSNKAAVDAENIITRDICIIVGGSRGTYSANRLQQLGKSVALLEKQSDLGGHVETFKNTVTGRTFDYGVVVFDNIPVVQEITTK